VFSESRAVLRRCGGAPAPSPPPPVSNVDNLGATVDLNILYHMCLNDVDFAVEVGGQGWGESCGHGGGRRRPALRDGGRGGRY